MEVKQWLESQKQRLVAKQHSQEKQSFWFGQVASGAKLPLNRPFVLAENKGRWPKPDRYGYRVRHSGPNRHERRKLAVETRGTDVG